MQQLGLIALALMVIVAPLEGQYNATIASTPPQILVSGRGEAKVTPDRATIQISVQTKAPTAAGAASENASLQQRVIAAIRAKGIPAEQISTIGYNVQPDYRYEQNREPRLIGYVVTNTVVVEVRRVDQVGPVIDAALGGGANMISSLHFYASNVDVERRNAMTAAMERARADAEALARAAGGTLGGLLEATVGGYHPPPPRPMMMRQGDVMAASEATSISPGEQTLTVEITARWAFVQGR